MVDNLEDLKKMISEKNDRDYNSPFSDCSICVVGSQTSHMKVNNDWINICKECDEARMLKECNVTTDKNGKIKNIPHGFYAFLHLSVTIAWIPLTWAASGDVLLHYLGDSKYIWELQWGFAVTGLIFNGYHFFQRIRKSKIKMDTYL